MFTHFWNLFLALSACYPRLKFPVRASGDLVVSLRYLKTHCKCDKACHLRLMLHFFWWFNPWYTYFLKALISWCFSSVTVACLICGIWRPNDFTFIGFSLDIRSDCIMGEWRLCFCAYITAIKAVLPVCFQFTAERIKLFDLMLKKIWLLTRNSFVIWFNSSVLNL